MSTSTEAILRGVEAGEATPARFNVDLRARQSPSELTDRVREQARATGYAEGWSQGQRAAQEAARAVAEQQSASALIAELARTAGLERGIGALVRAATELEQRVATDIAEVEDAVLHAAVQIAEALLGRELAGGAVLGEDALRRAMALVPPDGPVTVRLNPADYTAVTGSSEPEYEQAYQGRRVLLRPDPVLAPGDAVAECGATTVDAGLAAAVARVRKALSA